MESGRRLVEKRPEKSRVAAGYGDVAVGDRGRGGRRGLPQNVDHNKLKLWGWLDRPVVARRRRKTARKGGGGGGKRH